MSKYSRRPEEQPQYLLKDHISLAGINKNKAKSDTTNLLSTCSGDGPSVHPSLGRVAGKGDYTAIVVLATAGSPETRYVLSAELSRLRPEQMLEAVTNAVRLWNCDAVGVESVQFQELLIHQFKDRLLNAGLRTHVQEVRQTQDKITRIQSLHPLTASGKLLFSRRHVTLLEQLRQFPAATHDDGPDALEMAVRISRVSPVYGANFTYGGRRVSLS